MKSRNDPFLILFSVLFVYILIDAPLLFVVYFEQLSTVIFRTGKGFFVSTGSAVRSV